MELRQRAMDLLEENDLVLGNVIAPIAVVGNDLVVEIENIGKGVAREKETEKGIETVIMQILIPETDLAAEKENGRGIIVNEAVKTVPRGKLFDLEQNLQSRLTHLL